MVPRNLLYGEKELCCGVCARMQKMRVLSSLLYVLGSALCSLGVGDVLVGWAELVAEVHKSSSNEGEQPETGEEAVLY